MNPRATGIAPGPGPPPDETGFTFTPASRDNPLREYGTWRLRIPGGGTSLIVAIDTLDTQDCEHRYEARGHDPGVKLRHLSPVRHATCTSPVCRQPRGTATLSTTRRTKRADGPASATGARSVGTTTDSSSSPGGPWFSSRTAPSGGPRRPGAATTPNPPGTRSSRRLDSQRRVTRATLRCITLVGRHRDGRTWR